jgi:hypothetical protein
MGQSNSSKKNNFLLPTHVLSHDEFNDLINNNVTKRQLHNYMAENNKYVKIFICDRETDEDRLDPDYLDNCEVDDICADYVNRYYMAELKTKRTSCHPAVANMIWDGYHGEWSYGFDIYECHKIDKDYKKLFLKDYYFCDVDKRLSQYKTIHMSNDLNTILNVIKSLNPDIIEEKIISILREQSRLKEIAKINKAYGYKEPQKDKDLEYEQFKKYMECVLVD